MHWLNSGLGKVGHYKTLLHTAIKLGGKEVMSLLLSTGARAGQHNEDLGLSPIHAAVREGHLAILSLLLTNPGNSAEVRAVMRNGRTALHLAAEVGRKELVEHLLALEQCAVDGEDLMGRQSPLYMAVRGGHKAVARLLLEHGASPLAVVEGRTVHDYMKEVLPGLDPNTVAIKVKPKENTEQELLYSANRLLDKAQRAQQKGESNSHNCVVFRTLVQSLGPASPALLNTFS